MLAWDNGESDPERSGDTSMSTVNHSICCQGEKDKYGKQAVL